METLREEQIHANGNGSVIYNLGDGKAAKVLRYHGKRPDLANAQLRKEFQMAREVFDAGISCPKMYDLKNFNVFPSKIFYDFPDMGIQRPGIVMQFIDGRRLRDVIEELLSDIDEVGTAELEKHHELADKYWEEVERARNLGFSPSDAKFENALLTPDERIFLVDFECWRHRDELKTKSYFKQPQFVKQ
mgnify:CR=1 FL=1